MTLSFSKRVLVHFLVTRVDGTHHVTQCIRHKNFFFHFYSCQHHHRHSKCLCSSLFKCILPAVCVCPTIFSLFFWSNTLQRVFFSNNNNLLLVCTQTAQLNRPSIYLPAIIFSIQEKIRKINLNTSGTVFRDKHE